tara:strand:+ start:1005 stop:1448 length:444 start_codon:yes stop_codon:yes gene_type:complete
MADLIVTLTESLSLNTYAQGSTSKKTIKGINESSKRIVTLVDTTEVTLLSFGATIGAGTFITSNVKYVRITNLGKNEEIITLSLQTASDEAIVDLDPGYFFILSKVEGVLEADGSAIGSPGTALDLTAILAKSEVSSVDLEIFVASV